MRMKHITPTNRKHAIENAEARKLWDKYPDIHEFAKKNRKTTNQLPIELNGHCVYNCDNGDGWVFFFTYPGDHNTRPMFADYDDVYMAIRTRIHENPPANIVELLELIRWEALFEIVEDASTKWSSNNTMMQKYLVVLMNPDDVTHYFIETNAISPEYAAVQVKNEVALEWDVDKEEIRILNVIDSALNVYDAESEMPFEKIET